jgi:hypothetical protein
MNQTNSKELNLTALEARNLHAEIFELLMQIQSLADTKREAVANAQVAVEVSGGKF